MSLEKCFSNTGEDFSGLKSAWKWLTDNGYSFGILCGASPIGVMKGDFDIMKWRNLSSKDIEQLDGILVSDSFRDSDVILKVK